MCVCKSITNTKLEVKRMLNDHMLQQWDPLSVILSKGVLNSQVTKNSWGCGLDLKVNLVKSCCNLNT